MASGGQHQRNHQHASLDRYQHQRTGRQHPGRPAPRHVEFTRDSKQLWASAEIGGTVSVVDVDNREIPQDLTFKIKGVHPDKVQPVGIKLSSDGSTPRTLASANHIAVVDAKTYEVLDYLLVGRRVGTWHSTPTSLLLTTNGVSGDVSVIDVDKLQGHQVDQGRPLSLGRGGQPMNSLEVSDVAFAYGERLALDGVSFSAAQGRFTALLGPNGAGKSTLIALLTRLYDLQQADPYRRFLICAKRRARPLRALAWCSSRAHWTRPHGRTELRATTPRCMVCRGPWRTNVSSWNCSASSSASGDAARCANSMAVTVAVSKSPAPCCIGLSCCCSMRPAPVSIPPAAGAQRACPHALPEPAYERVVTTHLLDEVRDDDDLLILNRGRRWLRACRNPGHQRRRPPRALHG